MLESLAISKWENSTDAWPSEDYFFITLTFFSVYPSLITVHLHLLLSSFYGAVE